MTNPFGIDHNTFQAAANQIRDAFTEMGFQLAAQSTLGALLRGEPHDQTHTRLNTRPTNELERINRAARELTTLTDRILEDRERTTADESTQDTDSTKWAPLETDPTSEVRTV